MTTDAVPWLNGLMMRASRFAIVACVVSIIACRDTTVSDPTLPEGSIPLSVPGTYAQWWQQTEECSGLTGDLDGIKWFMLRDAASFTIDGKQVVGMWWSVRWILIAGPYIDDGPTVRHEMLHDLLRSGAHPPLYFDQKCAGVVR